MTNKIYSFLSLAARARKLISGEETCYKTIKKQKVFLVIISEDTAQNTRKKIVDSCNLREIPVRFYGSKEELGRRIGKEIRSVLAILDTNFAQKLIELIDNERNLHGGEVIEEKK